jgi:tetratricopeptide (TPR) repeat protein
MRFLRSRGWRLAWIAAVLAPAAVARGSPGGCSAEEIEAALVNPRAVEARQSLDQCAREEPRDFRSMVALARGYLRGRDEDRAVFWLERAERLEPGSSECQLWLGRAYGAQAIHANVLHQPSLARKVHRAFERAVELDPSNLSARFALLEYDLRAPRFLGGSPEKARAQAEAIRQRDALRGHRAFGRIAEEDKRWDVAAAEYERAREDSPESPEPLFWRARLAEQQKDYAAALDLLERLARMPSQREALYEIGRICAVSGLRLARGEEALKAYLEGPAATPDEPSFASAHDRLGALYQRKKDRALARREYTAALELDPMLTEARQALLRLKSSDK